MRRGEIRRATIPPAELTPTGVISSTSANANVPINVVKLGGGHYEDHDWEHQNGFRSRHGNGAQFCYADGSVHYLNDDIALAVYRALATIAGSEGVEGEAVE